MDFIFDFISRGVLKSSTVNHADGHVTALGHVTDWQIDPFNLLHHKTKALIKVSVKATQ